MKKNGLFCGLTIAAMLLGGCGPQAGRPYGELGRKTLSRRQVFRGSRGRHEAETLTEGGPVVIRDLGEGRQMMIIMGGKKYILPMRQVPSAGSSP